MGQWNTLHLFDEEKFYARVVPMFKQDADGLKEYCTSPKGAKLIEDSSIFSVERVAEIMKVSNSFSEDFRNCPDFVLNNPTSKDKKLFYDPVLEEIRALLFLITFSECALAFPYFKLGYRLFGTFLEFQYTDSPIEEKMEKIIYHKSNTTIFPGEEGIRNWINKEEVSQILSDFDQIKPKIFLGEAPSHNRFAITYVKDLHRFLLLAKENDWGLISCLDADLDLLKGTSPIGKDIDWGKLNAKDNFIRK